MHNSSIMHIIFLQGVSKLQHKLCRAISQLFFFFFPKIMSHWLKSLWQFLNSLNEIGLILKLTLFTNFSKSRMSLI